MFTRPEMIFEIEMRIFALEYRIGKIRKKMNASRVLTGTNFTRQIASTAHAIDKLTTALEIVQEANWHGIVTLPVQRADMPSTVAGQPFFSLLNDKNDKHSYNYDGKKYYSRNIEKYTDDTGVLHAIVTVSGPYMRRSYAVNANNAFNANKTTRVKSFAFFKEDYIVSEMKKNIYHFPQKKA